MGLQRNAEQQIDITWQGFNNRSNLFAFKQLNILAAIFVVSHLYNAASTKKLQIPVMRDLLQKAKQK
jgi:hypothetical protein